MELGRMGVELDDCNGKDWQRRRSGRFETYYDLMGNIMMGFRSMEFSE